ncbi:electron transfer flavoprotein regulatory factor 1 [Wyeomyia smithii]|uniref:electron transfer flavoprotein regulatory factor 1 n=1 Tax=Wyeomyia smithii TaxID=174621 RepID=UPI002467BA50|nr:electron transfer flavoprotein regulatory factor 1 [Wyeomyia smithii]XP_055544247.1 electron transfer flavoprotein regulatory factor 1 [Wyeomyia smithii]
MSASRRRVLDLYKRLQYLGREYPGGPEKFRQKCYGAFKRQSAERDPEKIEKAIALGEYVIKEIETLYSLRKYRAMKKRYYDN